MSKHTCRAFFICTILISFFSYFSFGNYWLGHWQNKWAFGLAILSTWYALWCSIRFGFVVFLPILLPLLSGIYVGLFQPSLYTKLGGEETLNFRFLAISSAFMFLIMVSFFERLPASLTRPITYALGLTCYLESIWIIAAFIHGVEAFNRGGLLGNASMAGSFVACLYPFTWQHVYFKRGLRGDWLWVLKRLLPIVGISLCGASQPVIILGLVAAAMVAGKIREVEGSLGFTTFFGCIFGYCVVPLLVLFFVIDNPDDRFFNDSGRMTMWTLGQAKFEYSFNSLIGGGIGSTAAWLPEMQVYEQSLNKDNNRFATISLWFHNDWLQLLFEMGFVALIAYFYLYLKCTYNAFKNDFAIFAALIGYGVMSFFNYPAHLFQTAFLGFFLVWASLQLDRKKQAS